MVASAGASAGVCVFVCVSVWSLILACWSLRHRVVSVSSPRGPNSAEWASSAQFDRLSRLVSRGDTVSLGRNRPTPVRNVGRPPLPPPWPPLPFSPPSRAGRRSEDHSALTFSFSRLERLVMALEVVGGGGHCDRDSERGFSSGRFSSLFFFVCVPTARCETSEGRERAKEKRGSGRSCSFDPDVMLELLRGLGGIQGAMPNNRRLVAILRRGCPGFEGC